MKRLAVIGCGLRADCYLAQMHEGSGKEWQIVAIADPVEKHRRFYKDRYSCKGAREYEDGMALLSGMAGNLDAILIATPNNLHTEPLIEAIRLGLVTLVEKPIVTTLEDCAAVWKVHCQHPGTGVAVGFVLRYTFFYGKVKELIDSGAIGKVLSIIATEELGLILTMEFNRQWRRLDSLSGSFLMEKSCHDLDLINWCAKGTPGKISSFATRTRFVPKPDAPMHCSSCRLTDTCRYSCSNIAAYLNDLGPLNYIIPLLETENDLCVFNSDKDVPDHQVVNVEYDSGVLATFALTMDQPRTRRTIVVQGTEGQIEGSIEADELKVVYHAPNKKTPIREEQVAIVHDDSGHHGGDSVIANQFKAMLRGEPTPPLAGLREGIDAVLMAIAAERSRKEGKIVNVFELFEKVYGSGAATETVTVTTTP